MSYVGRERGGEGGKITGTATNLPRNRHERLLRTADCATRPAGPALGRWKSVGRDTVRYRALREVRGRAEGKGRRKARVSGLKVRLSGVLFYAARRLRDAGKLAVAGGAVADNHLLESGVVGCELVCS